ncbi:MULTISPECIES: alkaline phosphatase family protein [unclassified Streptomyces]|uniref:alkaline phosphatase family protein n=1 Tax=unclassified Streptomyces TaxID=2593676 RepID=UPI002E29F7D3|nr:alkaline phosphatase family protein [Streptomyces sp. NBC_00223]
MTVYWMVWDAAARWIVDRLEAEGALPAVSELRARGCRAAGRPPTPNCQTPPSLATLFTGAATGEHGVSGFGVPGDGDVFGYESGFAPGFPARPPVWRTLAGRGVRTAFVHAPWVFDGEGRVGATVDAAIEAYSTRSARYDVLPLTPGAVTAWPAGGLPVEVDTTAGGVLLRAGGTSYDLTGSPSWTPVRLGAGTGFWARCRDTARGPALVRTGTWTARTAGADRSLVDALAGTPVFAGEGVGPLYRGGLFGPRLVDGGDGSAEEEFVASVDCVVRSFGAAVQAVLDGHHADLVVMYLPWTDDIGHEMSGWCDERSAAHRPKEAARIWDAVRHCYRAADDLLGRVLRRAAEDDTVILGADHGMVGSTHLVHVNEALIAAGLAARGADGGLDPRRSDVVYHPANNGSLRVNHEGLAHGRVPARLTGVTMRRALAALRELRGPHGALPVVRGFLDERGRPLDEAEPGPLAFVVLADDYQPSSAVDGGPVLRPMPKSAAHVVNTGDDRLHATFAAAGPGLPAGADLGEVDNSLAARLVLHRFGAGPEPDEPCVPLLARCPEGTP